MSAKCRVSSVELMEGGKVRAHYTVVVERGPIAAGATFIPLEDMDSAAVTRVFESIENAINVSYGFDEPEDDIGGALDSPDEDLEEPL